MDLKCVLEARNTLFADRWDIEGERESKKNHLYCIMKNLRLLLVWLTARGTFINKCLYYMKNLT